MRKLAADIFKYLIKLGRTGLPALKPQVPWYGYSLGYWTEENEEEAGLALKGERYKTGEKLEKPQETAGVLIASFP